MILNFANDAYSTLAAGIGAGDLSLSVQPGHGARFPSANFKTTLVKSTGEVEVILCTSRTGDVFTIVRAQEGTTGVAFSSGDAVSHNATKGTYENFPQEDELQIGQFEYAGASGGTVDALTATLASGLTTLTDGQRVRARATGANTVAAPTLDLTLGSTATGAKDIVKGDNRALSPGDIPGAGAIIELEYRSTFAPGKWVLLNPAKGVQGGQQTVWIPAAAMTTRTTNGPAAAVIETSVNKVMLRSLDFDKDTNEFAQFAIGAPKGWDEGTVTAVFYWANASGTGAVVWGIQGVAMSDDDALDAAFGTAVTVTDNVTAAGDVMISAASAAMTLAGSIAEGDYLTFQVYRDAAAGGDTLAVDARLLGVKVIFNFNAADDA